MKRLLLTALLTVCCMVSWAFDVGNFTYEQYAAATTSDYATVTVTGLTAAGRSTAALTIPASIEYNGTTYRVVRIKQQAFANYTHITSVKINYGVQVIEKQAFQNCTALSTVKLASSVKLINQSAFDGCTALKNVYYNRPYPPTAGSEGWYSSTFPSNSGMTLYIAKGDPNGVYKFKNSSPAPCGKFAYIIKSEDCYDFYFSDESGGKVIVTKAPTKTTYGEMMIVGLSASATSFNVTRSSNWISVSGMSCYYTAIADSAFLGNTKFTSADFNSLTKLRRIGAGAFRNCTNLTSATNIKCDTIQTASFIGCSKLSSVSLLDGVKRIESCFQNTALTTLSIPKTVTYINYYFVDDCSKLATITVDYSNSYYSSYDGCLYNKDYTIFYRAPEAHATTDFYKSDITFHSAVNKIKAYSFQGMQNVTKIIFPFGVKTLEERIFSSSKKLSWVVIPASVTSWGNSMFSGCTSLKQLYVNHQTPKTIADADFFSGAPATINNLYVPYGKVDAYKSAGWTRFSNYNNGGEQGFDFYSLMDITDTSRAFIIPMTVTSTASTTLNGTTYDGRARIVCGRGTMTTDAEFTIPEYVIFNGKKYLVNRIGEEAFRSTSSYRIKGCAAVDTISDGAFYYNNNGLTSITLPSAKVIGESAFRLNTKLTSVTFGPNLKRINAYAFHTCSALAQDMIMPYGFWHLGAAAFNGTKVARLLLPGSLTSSNSATFNGMSYLAELIYNIPYKNPNNSNVDQSMWKYDFTGVPTTCKVRVPTGSVNQYRGHNSWKVFGTNITAGGHDFTYGTGYSSSTKYHMTILSTASVTVDGVTYDGKAKYVYHPNIETATGSIFSAAAYETDNTYSGGKKYLITEFGDSCFVNGKFTSYTTPTGLERIGDYAFYNSAITGNVRIPGKINYIGKYSFYNCSNLTELFIEKPTGGRSWGYYTYGNNASTFYCYVPDTYYYSVKGFSTPFGSTSRLNAYLKESKAGMRTFSIDYAADYVASNLEAYTIGLYDRTTATAYVDQCNQAAAGTGVLIDNLKANTEYRIKRASGTPASVNNLLVATLDQSVDVSKQNVGFYLVSDTKSFKRPTSTYNIGQLQAYLRLASGIVGTTTQVMLDIYPLYKKGDINGDGNVDVADVALLIDVVLGKKSITDPAIKGDCHVAGNATVDVADISALINIVLGK